MSTDGQTEYSPDSQIKLCMDYASKHGMFLAEEFIFSDEGISGKDARHRPAFNQMVAQAKSKEHPFDVILVWKFSRFARNQEEAIVYKGMLSRANVEVVSISEPIIEGPFGSLIERILEWMDEYYLINLSGEVKRGMAEKVSRGEPVVPPAFGYTMKDKNYVPDPAQAPIVKEVFEQYAAGVGMRAIVVNLRNEGVLTKFGNAPDNRFVEYMLNNPVYIGKIRWSKGGRVASARDYAGDNLVISDGRHEAIISDELFKRVQTRLSEQRHLYGKYQRREQPVEWMLKGLVKCSACGSTLVRVSLKEPAMQCHQYAKGQCHTSHYLANNKANTALIGALHNCVETMTFSMLPKQVPEGTSNDDLGKALAQERNRLKRAKAAYQNGVDTLEEYAETKQAIQTRIAELEAQVCPPLDKKEQKKHLEAFANKVSEVLAVIEDGSVSESAKNEALRSVIKYVVFDKFNQQIQLFFYE